MQSIFSNLFLLIVLYGIGAQIASASESDEALKKIDIAVDIIQTACVAGGESVKMKAEGAGELSITGVLSSGLEGKVVLNKETLKGLADATSALSAAQATEMRNCMKPYISQILEQLWKDDEASVNDLPVPNSPSPWYVVSGTILLALLINGLRSDGTSGSGGSNDVGPTGPTLSIPVP